LRVKFGFSQTESSQQQAENVNGTYRHYTAKHYLSEKGGE